MEPSACLKRAIFWNIYNALGAALLKERIPPNISTRIKLRKRWAKNLFLFLFTGKKFFVSVFFLFFLQMQEKKMFTTKSIFLKFSEFD